MEYAAYNFKLENGDRYDNTEICVMASSYDEAERLANQLVGGSNVKVGKLRRVIDLRLQIQQTDVLERKVLIEERQSKIDVKHSGELTEVRVDGGKRNSV